MAKKIVIYIVIFVVFISCEEIYHPDLKEVNSLLVIEALVTNSPDKNFIKITRASNFNESNVNTPVNNAVVELISEEGNIYNGFLSSSGNYSLPFSINVGHKYKLKVSVSDTVYVSEFQKMPELPAIDSVYIEVETNVLDAFSSSGVPYKKEFRGAQVYADIPVNNQLNHYRFNWSSVFLYIIPPPDPPPPIPPGPPSTYCWETMPGNGDFILTALPRFSSSTQLLGQPLLFRLFDYESFIPLDDLELRAYGNGWIVMFEQFGLSEETYVFYEQLEKQLNAEGKLFDPINTQLVCNMKCETHQEVKVLGIFEVSSHLHFRYYLHTDVNPDKVFYYKINTHYEIPNKGKFMSPSYPYFWESR